MIRTSVFSFLAIACTSAFSAQMASQQWVIRRIEEATNNIFEVGGYATIEEVDAKISTNNEAFVSAVLSVPLTGADASDLAEIAEYGGYGTVGAALLALIAGLAALKRRMGTADVAIAQKADAADLPYRLVEPGEWEFSGVPDGVSNYRLVWDDGWFFAYYYEGESYGDSVSGAEDALELSFILLDSTITATRPSLPGHLCDRAGNRVVVSGDTTLTLPALVNAGKSRDFYVRLTVSAAGAGSTVTWAVAQGETWDAIGAPPSSFASGTYLYHITEVAPGVWHCEDMFAVAGKMPMYPMVAVAPSSGTLTVTPYTVATYTAGASAAAFAVAVGTGTAGMARDCELVIDCTATGAVAPTVTWPAAFHPRTDAATDFACEAGTRNVYFISEFSSGEFAVGGWQETTGGNAS